MKNLLRTAKNWLNKKNAQEPEEKAPAAAAAPVMASVQPAPVVQAPPPAAKRVVRIEPDPVPVAVAPINMAVLNSGPEVKIFTRSSKTYATCPHCEASWNLRERVSHPSFRRDENKGLTCPACDKGVSLPSTLDLRKLS